MNRLVLALGLVLIGTVSAVAAPPVFRVTRADGRTVSGPLSELTADWGVRLGRPAIIRVAGAEVVALRQEGRALPPFPHESQLLLAGGDRLAGSLAEITSEFAVWRAPWAEQGQLRVPLDAVAVLWLADPANVEDPPRFRRQLLARKRTRDVAYLRNGDILEGTITGLDATDRAGAGLHIETDNGPVTVQRGRVAVLALSTELLRPALARGVYGRVVLTDGSRVSLATATADLGVLTGTTLFDNPVRLSLVQVVAVNLVQGRATYLSDLPPTSFHHDPFLGLSFPLVRDGSAAGGDLRIGGDTFDRGLGLHSRSTVVYALEGQYRRFQAVVGLDARSGRQGHVTFRVWNDGREADLGWGPGVAAADGARPVDLDVSGVMELKLQVDFGRGGDVQDYLNLGDARLIR